MSRLFDGYYQGKKVLVSGHTGFKGSWMCLWLEKLGAKIVGYSLDPPTDPSLFEATGLAHRIIDVRADVRDLDRLNRTIQEHQPEVIFHLAAQPLVRLSYAKPRYTFEVNVMGAVNLLEAARACESVRSAVIITSDKCYHHGDYESAYRESDPLGGHDRSAYSASKACMEIVAGAYQNPLLAQATRSGDGLVVASCRAGNVIGGGDWALDRIVPDAVRAIVSHEDVVLRNPTAVRPWQHVFEAISAYLWLAVKMAQDPQQCACAWNFGPSDMRMTQVVEIVEGVFGRWPENGSKIVIEHNPNGGEAAALSLDISKAIYRLGWEPVWDIEQTLDALTEWYHCYYSDHRPDMAKFSLDQIDAYAKEAGGRKIAWAV